MSVSLYFQSETAPAYDENSQIIKWRYLLEPLTFYFQSTSHRLLAVVIDLLCFFCGCFYYYASLLLYNRSRSSSDFAINTFAQHITLIWLSSYLQFFRLIIYTHYYFVHNYTINQLPKWLITVLVDTHHQFIYLFCCLYSSLKLWPGKIILAVKIRIISFVYKHITAYKDLTT